MTINAVIDAHNAGDRAATSQLLQRLYTELRRIASRLMLDERRSHTLQATALVNEAYIRLFSNTTTRINDRNHFLNLAAGTMRQILIDHARRRSAQKRGGNAIHVTLEDSWPPAPEAAVDLVELGNALAEFRKDYERQARVIDLRYFVGFSVKETAVVLGVSDKTIKNDAQFAKAWLHRQLTA